MPQLARKHLEATLKKEDNGSMKTEKKLQKLLSKLLNKVYKLLMNLLTMPRKRLMMLGNILKITPQYLLVRPIKNSNLFVRLQEFAIKKA